jgi:hypothetical protein
LVVPLFGYLNINSTTLKNPFGKSFNMGNIVWIASFPKSGNTWMRAFLANYILDRTDAFPINQLGSFSLSDTRPRFFHEAAGKPVEQLSQNETISLRHDAQKLIADSKEHDHFVKTHSQYGTFNKCQLINAQVTKGAIYLVRNPLDLVISYSAHLGVSINEAIDTMGEVRNSTIEQDSSVLTIIGHWSEHVNSWLNNKDIPRILVKYEDLIKNPNVEFKKTLTTLGINVDEDRLRRAIKFSSFSELANQELEGGFRERPPHAERFFRQGTVDQWSQKLTNKQIGKVEEIHGSVMKKLGYI